MLRLDSHKQVKLMKNYYRTSERSVAVQLQELLKLQVVSCKPAQPIQKLCF